MDNNKLEINKTTGAILSDLRKKNRLSQKDLAERLSVSKSSISHYETGDTLPPVDVLIALADLYDVTTDYLLGRCYSDYNFSKFFNTPFVKTLSHGKLMSMINNLNTRGKNFLAETMVLLDNSSDYSKENKKKK